MDGTLAPSISVNGLNTDLVMNSDATLQVTLAGTGAGQFSQVNVAGPVTLNDPTLVIDVTGNLAIGNSFEIIYAPTGSITGSFSNGSFTAANLPGYTFSVTVHPTNVVLTVTQVPTTDVFEVEAGTGTFGSPGGVNNDLTVTKVANVYTIADANEPIVLGAGATAAGWTHVNSNEITGPANLSNLSFSTVDGSDDFESLAAGSANVSITGFGSLAIDGPITTTGSISISTYSSVEFSGNVTATGSITVSSVGAITDDPATLTAASLNLAAANGIGTAIDPILTNSPSITVSAGPQGDLHFAKHRLHQLHRIGHQHRQPEPHRHRSHRHRHRCRRDFSCRGQR